jgi:hypothetical protein
MYEVTNPKPRQVKNFPCLHAFPKAVLILLHIR